MPPSAARDEHIANLEAEVASLESTIQAQRESDVKRAIAAREAKADTSAEIARLKVEAADLQQEAYEAVRAIINGVEALGPLVAAFESVRKRNADNANNLARAIGCRYDSVRGSGFDFSNFKTHLLAALGNAGLDRLQLHPWVEIQQVHNLTERRNLPSLESVHQDVSMRWLALLDRLSPSPAKLVGVEEFEAQREASRKAHAQADIDKANQDAAVADVARRTRTAQRVADSMTPVVRDGQGRVLTQDGVPVANAKP
jgi:DNA repair exonuclease SbcCD ATPase subunit